MEKDINICLSTDDNYIHHTAVVVASILSNAKNRDNYHFYILSTRLSSENKKKFNKLKKIKNCKIDYIDIDEKLVSKFSAVDTHKHLNLSIYNRLFIPNLLPHLDKVIYLDSDIVTVHNISNLNNIDLDNAYFLAVQDPFSEKHAQNLGYSNYPYINSGVMVINCAALRQNNYLEQLICAIEKIKDNAKAGDQDFINYCFHKHIKTISPQWNVFLPFNYKRYGMKEPATKEYKLSKKKPFIIHFVGPMKPWMKETSHPFKKIFYKYYKKTDWYKSEQKSKRKTVLNNIKKILTFGSSQKEQRHQQQIYNKTKELPNKYPGEENLLKQIRSDISFYLSVSCLHTQTFSKYKNINSGKDVVLLATGPSLDYFKPIKNAVYVGVNKAFSCKDIKLDYLILQDYEGAKFYLDEIFEYKKSNPELKLLYGITGYTPNDQWLIPESISLRHGAERYYNLYRPEEKVWGEDFSYDILNNPLKCFGSVTFAAMQFILWTNPKRIYLVGCDNSQKGYAKDIMSGTNKLNTSRGMEGWKNLKYFTGKFYPETEIISVNPDGLKGIFTDLYQN